MYFDDLNLEARILDHLLNSQNDVLFSNKMLKKIVVQKVQKMWLCGASTQPKRLHAQMGFAATYSYG